jgi:hypothetical protein
MIAESVCQVLSLGVASAKGDSEEGKQQPRTEFKERQEV